MNVILMGEQKDEQVFNFEGKGTQFGAQGQGAHNIFMPTTNVAVFRYCSKSLWPHPPFWTLFKSCNVCVWLNIPMLLRDEHDPVLGAVGRGRRAPRRHHLLLLMMLPLMLLLMQILVLIMLPLMQMPMLMLMLLMMDAPQSSLSASLFQYSHKVANYCITMIQASQHFAIIRIKMAWNVWYKWFILAKKNPKTMIWKKFKHLPYCPSITKSITNMKVSCFKFSTD